MSLVNKATLVDLSQATGFDTVAVDIDGDGFGDETASLAYKFNVLNGSSTNDTITGNNESTVRDTLVGNGGDDTFYVSDGGDRIEGGEEVGTEDTYDFSGMSVGTGDAGVTVVMNSVGDSTAIGAGVGSSTFIEIENIVGSNGVDTITGDSSSNTIESGSGNDTIFGSDGVDVDGGVGDEDWLSYDGVGVE